MPRVARPTASLTSTRPIGSCLCSLWTLREIVSAFSPSSLSSLTVLPPHSERLTPQPQLPPWPLRQHAPASNGAVFDRPEDHILDEQPEQDDGQQAGEHVRDQQLVLVLVDEPADASGTGTRAEEELGGNERAPCERPADLQPGENAGKRAGNENPGDIADGGQPVIQIGRAHV